MATMTETDVSGHYHLHVHPQPLHLRSGNKQQGLILAPPPSREPSINSSNPWSEKAESELRPVDRGIGAWRFLVAAFMMEGFMFGYPINYGVFQSYYFTHAPLAGNTHLSTIGTFGTCFLFLGAPIATYLVQKYSRWQQEAIWTGFAISIIGLAAAGWAEDFGSLLATQGCIFGVGLMIMFYPIFNMMNDWFLERRGLALGIICASTGITGLFIPFVLNFLLHKYGPVNTLRLSALGLLLLCGPCLPLLKPRIPVPCSESAPCMDYSFLKMPLFYFFALAQLLQGLAYYVPLIYLPSYATSLGLSGTMGALLLVVASFAQVLGQMAFGFVSDMRIPRLWVDGRVPVHILLFVSTFVSGISILVLWGPARSLGMLIAFAALYGMSAGGFAVLWARMSTTLSSSPSLALTTFSYFALTKGIGNVLTGPIGSALISRSPHADRDVYADGKFEGIVLYSGACMLASAAVMVAWGAGRKMVGVMRRGKGEEGKEGCAA